MPQRIGDLCWAPQIPIWASGSVPCNVPTHQLLSLPLKFESCSSITNFVPSETFRAEHPSSFPSYPCFLHTERCDARTEERLQHGSRNPGMPGSCWFEQPAPAQEPFHCRHITFHMEEVTMGGGEGIEQCTYPVGFAIVTYIFPF